MIKVIKASIKPAFKEYVQESQRTWSLKHSETTLKREKKRRVALPLLVPRAFPLIIGLFGIVLPQDLLPNLVEADLLSSTDMFLADGKLVLEQPTRLLLWDTNSGDFGIIIPRPSIIDGQDTDGMVSKLLRAKGSNHVPNPVATLCLVIL